MEERIAALLNDMSDEEKAELLYGKDFWYAGSEKCGRIMLTDGPAGLRKQAGRADMSGINESIPATLYPAACAAACSWDESLLFRQGEMLGKECRKEGVSVLLGPAVNHKRSPLCGRNFEYYSEDPHLTGRLGAAYVKGLQGTGVGAAVKHFACNSQEADRMINNSIADERALREIYLKQFETIIKEAEPYAVMTAYNKLNGIHCAQNKRLMQEIARGEWGYRGLFLTDWGAMHDQTDSYNAGTDLEMPGICGSGELLVQAVRSGRISAETLHERAADVLRLILRTADQNEASLDFDAGEALRLAQEIAEKSAVLLKNEGVLPYDRGDAEKIAVIGAFAEKPRNQGGGSGKVVPSEEDNFLQALTERGIRFDYARGYRRNSPEEDGALIAEAVAIAGVRRRAVIFAGLLEEDESEGYDRQTLSLPPSHDRLIMEVAKVNPNVVVVLSCGAPVAMPWLDHVKGVLMMYLAGCQSGKACASLLFGDVNPSGKLAETFPLQIEDSPCAAGYGKYEDYAEYRESIFTGYRWYDAAQKKVLFPFGFGLSYTAFEYGCLSLSGGSFSGKGTVSVRVNVKNTGTAAGAETVQIYVSQKNPKIFKPEKELRAFRKIFLNAGEEQELVFTLTEDAFSHYSIDEKRWKTESGIYEIFAAASSRDLRSGAAIYVQGDEKESDMRGAASAYYDLAAAGEIPREQFYAMSGLKYPEERQILPITPDSPIKDLAKSRGGKLLGKAIVKLAGIGKDRRTAKMQRCVAAEMPVRGLTMGIRLSRRGVDGLVQIANGHRLKGFLAVIKDLWKYRKRASASRKDKQKNAVQS